ncbi:unnamed protein product [Nesidiocoris tenuis]|uniref:Uncharacterized protein n=1 Tax=Nesidiocoris tenuis TaxID=355587 RepID=A0A6H5GRI8_9HEMI|nr:unnamed protein product [Nesidiocoris tenuis]
MSRAVLINTHEHRLQTRSVGLFQDRECRHGVGRFARRRHLQTLHNLALRMSKAPANADTHAPGTNPLCTLSWNVTIQLIILRNVSTTTTRIG